MRYEVDDLYPEHLEELKRRSDAALETCGFDGFVAYSGGHKYYFLDDHAYSFKPNPLFHQWVPLDDLTESFLLYAPGEQPLLCFHQPADYWHRPPAVPTAAWSRAFRIEVTRDPAAARPALGTGGRRIAFLGEWQEEFANWGFAAVNPPDLINYLHYFRAVKTSYEIACMRSASEMAVHGHLAAREAFRAGLSEFETQQAYCSAAGLREQELPYGNIIAFNEAGSVLHYQHLERRPAEARRSFLIDAGAQFRGYASDITRTYSGGDADFADLIGRMHALELHLCESVRDGTDYRDIHLKAHELVAGLLKDTGIINCETSTAVETGLSSVFFPHGIGHLLGLQVHDVAGLAGDEKGTEIPRPDGHPHLRLTRCLEPGFVVTIEPGIYFIDMLLEAARDKPAGKQICWDRVEHFKPFGGIRIEDDVLCTSGDPVNLTREAFASIEPAT
jgi:Xaa-Pro dipeptidase